MPVGYIVGVIVAVCIVLGGCIAVVYAKKNQKKKAWAVGAILLGIAALLSAVINYNRFG